MKKYKPYRYTFFFLLVLFSLRANSAERLYNYPEDSLYQTAYRFLALNKSFEVTKEDPEMGTILFTYADNGVIDKHGSVEVIKDSTTGGANKVRLQVPSISDGTTNLLLDELNKKIESDFSPPGLDEQVFDYPYDKVYSSVYRYLSIDKKFEVTDRNKEKGIIYFLPKETGSVSKKSWAEIIRAQNGYKVRVTIPTLASSSIRTLLLGIQDKIKSDYSKGN